MTILKKMTTHKTGERAISIEPFASLDVLAIPKKIDEMRSPHEQHVMKLTLGCSFWATPEDYKYVRKNAEICFLNEIYGDTLRKLDSAIDAVRLGDRHMAVQILFDIRQELMGGGLT